MKRIAIVLALSLLRGGCPSNDLPPADGGATAHEAAPPGAFAEIAAGDHFTCARLVNGMVRCWGWNSSGELGDGTFDDRDAPGLVTGLARVRRIAAGRRHACALRDDGAVLCWGDNFSESIGRKGDNARTPFEVVIAKDVTGLALGRGTTCVAHALDVGCWGEYVNHGNSTSDEVRFHLPGPASAVFAGGGRACAIVAGRAHCWGDNERIALAPGFSRRLEEPEPAMEHVSWIAMGSSHVCTVGDDHHVRCAGGNSVGQLGDGTLDDRAAFVTVRGIEDATSAIVLDAASCALLRDGSVSCWGGNTSGQLGDGTTTARAEPRPVAGLRDIAEIAGTAEHACALSRDHRVFCWGSNMFGELGQASLMSSAVPVDVAGIEGATKIAAGGDGTCARLGDGSVACVGATPLAEKPSIQARKVTGIPPVDGVAMSPTALCSRTSEGRLWCIGNNSTGELGEGAEERWLEPRELQAVREVDAIAFGVDHACALFAGGKVGCWGKNDFAQTGIGKRSFGDRAHVRPARIGSLDDVRAVAAGAVESCALTGDGKVHCWGAPTQSWYGIDPDPTELFPIHLTPATLPIQDAIAIAHGRRHGCAITRGGRVQCWGRNDYGQLGDGTVSGPRVAPAPVADLDDAVEVALGAFFGCARRANGKVACWGDNYYGQLGDRTHVDRPEPVEVVSLEGATAIALGDEHACAIVAGGRVKCWGDNAHRQLGRGAPLESATPLEVRLAR